MIDTFVNFSGGLDSAYFLYKWLEQNKGNDKRILVHHCLYSNRAKIEEKASQGIIDELKNMGYKNFAYITSAARFHKKPDRDIIVMASMGAFVAHLHQIKRVMLTYSKEESSELHQWLTKAKTIQGFDPRHRYSIANQVFQSIYRRNEVEFFLLEQEKGLISRRQMIKELPEKLLRLVSFCRHPSEIKRICGKCFTCRRTVPFLKEQKKLELFVVK